ncbi:hypothetical protein [Rhodococcus sp. X156]|uniref:hypothetical protein n=1 Tax=Rhodococcus sp. X156 TaxID=2499145 RepID=UPI000FD8D878|nr:hypothetical protein [Rhodococcus sp. X156]
MHSADAVSADETRLAYRHAGDPTSPAVVLLHGSDDAVVDPVGDAGRSPSASPLRGAEGKMVG